MQKGLTSIKKDLQKIPAGNQNKSIEMSGTDMYLQICICAIYICVYIHVSLYTYVYARHNVASPQGAETCQRQDLSVV